MLALKFLILVANSVVILVFTCYVNFMYYWDVHYHSHNAHMKNYDYIVVGAGSAGLIVATQLADNGQNVLLLEAGGIAPPLIDIPLLAPLLQNTPYDWQHITISQKNSCKGLINNQSRWPMGKIVGGSSRLNYMAHVYGHFLDYKQWFPDYTDYVAKKIGSIKISKSRWNSGLGDIVLTGLQEMNESVSDINEKLNIGFMKVKLFAENGKRWSTDKLLYEKHRDTLDIVTHVSVNKVLMDANKATGVEFVKLNIISKVTAKSGVILSAGTVGSAKLLMLSGIGPRKNLEKIKIDVINDLPVGQNLVDHVTTGIDLVTIEADLPLSIIDALNPLSAISYFFFGEGPWTSSAIEVLGTFHSTEQKNISQIPNLQLMVLPAGISTDYGTVLKKVIGISDKIYDEYFAPLEHQNAITIAPVLLHPKSVGQILLRSNDPTDEPLIDPKYLSNEEDINTLVDGIQYVKKLIQTKALRKLGASLYQKTFPGCEDQIFDSVKYWKCYVQHLTLSAYHPAGTCRMGDVVDTSFRVYNTSNLYVVDASVLPSLPSANPIATILMLAEKAVRTLIKMKKE